jgi:hypothetical protein
MSLQADGKKGLFDGTDFSLQVKDTIGRTFAPEDRLFFCFLSFFR